jgi:hypothetical protein
LKNYLSSNFRVPASLSSCEMDGFPQQALGPELRGDIYGIAAARSRAISSRAQPLALASFDSVSTAALPDVTNSWNAPFRAVRIVSAVRELRSPLPASAEGGVV